MREYGKVSPQFWVGSTGKQLRGDVNAQLLALYLMSSPHSRMTGVFYCPVSYMAHETGIPFEGASKALQRLEEASFCEYDHDSETIFVVRMAAYQIGEDLKPKDNRIAGLRKEVANMPETRMKSSFLRVYGEKFGLVDEPEIHKKTKGLGRGSEAPRKPGAGAGAGKGIVPGAGSTTGPQASHRDHTGTGPDDAADGDDPAPIVVLPLVDGTSHPVAADDVDRWRPAYPAVDLDRELHAMASWLDANPRNRKTPGGIERFIVAWLAKAQDRAARVPDARPPGRAASVLDDPRFAGAI